jgi:hypothetical protein
VVGFFVLPFLTPSETLKGFIKAIATPSAILAYCITLLLWKSAGKEKRWKAIKTHIWIGIISAIIGIGILFLIRPETAKLNPCFAGIRKGLLFYMLVPNLGISLAFGGVVYSFVAIMVLASPSMKKPTGRRRDENREAEKQDEDGTEDSKGVENDNGADNDNEEKSPKE